MNIDLIILGILIEKPLSAYDLQKDIEYHHYDRWSRISIPSIYKKVIKLEEKGLLKSTTIQGSKLTNKVIYSITDAGIAQFNTLMTQLSLASPLVIFDFNILIANITKLPYARSLALIQNLDKKLAEALQAYRTWQEEFSDIPFNGKEIINQQISVYITLAEWLDNVKQQFIQYNDAGEIDGDN